MTKYFVHHQGHQAGPLTADEVFERLERKELFWTDYVYDESSRDWLMLMEFGLFAERFKSLAQPAPAPVVAENVVTMEPGAERAWYILKDDNKHGPFSYLDLVKMLQDKKLYEHDFIWHSEMSSWLRVSEVDDFKPEKIRHLKNSDSTAVTDVFFRRRHARVGYGASILVHDNKDVWRGHSLEISAGGAGIVIDSDTLQLNSSVYLHFKAGDGVPPFNATCTVISKTKVTGLQYRYGVKFTSISQSVQKAIKKYSDKKAS